ncbi:probable helicase senataxin isoform X2 [Diachasmimorpha longicaudata]|uniref:probable helicase senataxin isoform X2 n=1 Tax=Diachasmimorpha longicaudata TaxID=58733 RepID=UPI0030B86D56
MVPYGTSDSSGWTTCVLSEETNSDSSDYATTHIADKLSASSEIQEKIPHLMLDEFLFHVLRWKPRWLTGDQSNEESSDQFQSSRPTSLSYETIEDYCKVMLPLLLLEFWQVLKKDRDDQENERKDTGNEMGKGKRKGKEEMSRTITATLEDEILGSAPNGDYPFLILSLSASPTATTNYPVRGDLVKFLNNREEIFGYIQDCKKVKTVQSSWSSFVELQYSMKTQKLKYNWSSYDTLKLTTVYPMGAYLRFVRAMDDLSMSPLFQPVMTPKVEDYELPQADVSSTFPLISGHTLNFRQQEIVARIVKTVRQNKPKIALIQGPPGTGKSKVILNIICEVLKRKNTKLLLCAPSNRAIDEVVGNLITVQKEREGIMDAFTIVRIGRDEKMGAEVQEVSLSFRSKMVHFNPRMRNMIEAQILKDADVIATTLSSCYTFQMENIFGVDGLNIPVCIVDEAAQATELGTLIPLMLGVSTLILVGDPKQLPPTVLCERAKINGLVDSLFYRAKKNFDNQQGDPILMLNTQYRMVEEIVQWPNNFFYQGALRTGSNVFPLPFTNYKIIHHLSPQDGNDSNLGEAKLVVDITFGMVVELVKNSANTNVSIGIITPYRKQRKVILSLLKDRCDAHAPKKKNIIIAKARDVDDNDNETLIDILKDLYLTDNIEFDDWEDRLSPEPTDKTNVLQISNQDGKDPEEKDNKENEGKSVEDSGKAEEKDEPAEKNLVEVDEDPSPLYLKLKSIQVNTVDSFQGQERDIIIMSYVRSKGIGFLNDPNRLCVALTRAKHTLILCGNFKTFTYYPMWNSLLTDAEDRSAYVRLTCDASPESIMEHVIVGEDQRI